MPPVDICCLHPSSRSLSPHVESARRLPSALALDGILTATALPEDHPHALRIPGRKPPRMAKNLLKSPSFANKLKGQLKRRATIRSLKVEVFDEDARAMTSEDVLEMVGRSGGGGDAPPPLRLRLRESSLIDRPPLCSSPDLSRLETRASGAPARRVRSAFALGVARKESSQLSETSDVELRDFAYLNLDLASHQLDGKASPLDTGAEPTEEVNDGSGVDATIDDAVNDTIDVNVGEDTVENIANLREPQPVLVSDGLEEPLEPPSAISDQVDESVDATNPNDRSDSHASFHLSRKHISQQLRSMSQLSGPSDASDRHTPEAWTFHRREQSSGFAAACNVNSSRSRHMYNTSDTGVLSSHVPAAWGQVIKEPDASSSIYSRPTSPEMPEPYEIPADLAAVVDWPLKTELNAAAVIRPEAEAEEPSCRSSIGDDIHITIVEPGAPSAIALEDTPTDLSSTKLGHSDPLERAPSYKSGSSSTTKRSRFLEKFTPPKKSVKKRRSFFKFLRPGSRRKQTRSISTPVLYSPDLQPFVDGPSDDNELLTVQYELTNQGGQPTRSVSMNNLPATTGDESQAMASSPELRRKPSLAEYERHLSIVGDNRRRPSTKELKRLSQIEEDDRHEHVATKQPLSFYSRTQDTDPLMEAALERQLSEKAMFRSPSKRSVPFSEISSMSFFATSWDELSSAQPQSPERDPLDIESKRPSASHLSPPRTPIDGRSRTSSFSNKPKRSSKKPVLLHTPSSVSKDSTKSKVASSLDSWSRYPSHTRGERCASAGPSDNVRAFDFALDIKHERIRGTDESDPFSPGRRVLTERSTASSKRALPKSSSATFGYFARYFSSLVSSPDFHGKNRRTSVAAGGMLDHPELEILPPAIPASAVSQPAMHLHEMDLLRPGGLAHIREQTEESVEKPDGFQIHDQHLYGALESADPAPISFRSNSVFEAHAITQAETNTSRSGRIGSDGPIDYFHANISDHSHQTQLNEAAGITTPNLDGVAETTTTIDKSGPPSKAQAFRDLYQDCLVIPPSPAIDMGPYPAINADTRGVPPPPPLTFKPTKRRSTTQQLAEEFTLDPSAAIRRFPSVTVVDDRKGHWRSVSFISVRSSNSGASFVRESSNDLLRLMEAREREEREKLLGDVGVGV